MNLTSANYTLTNRSSATNQSSNPGTSHALPGGFRVPTDEVPKGWLMHKPKLMTREQIVNRIKKEQAQNKLKEQKAQNELKEQNDRKAQQLQAKMNRLVASAEPRKKKNAQAALPEDLFNPTNVERMQKGRHLIFKLPGMAPMGEGFPEQPFKSNYPQATLGHVKEFGEYCGCDVLLGDKLPKSLDAELGGTIVLIGDPNHYSVEVDKIETFLVAQNIKLSEKGDGDIVLAEGRTLCKNLETILPMMPGAPKSTEKFCLDIEDRRFHPVIVEARDKWMACGNQLLALIGLEESTNPAEIFLTVRARKDEMKSAGGSELVKQQETLYEALNNLLEDTREPRDKDMKMRITQNMLFSKSPSVGIFANSGTEHADWLYRELKELFKIIYVRPTKWEIKSINY